MLQDIINDNSYPVVFIGSGISKRYLKDFPTWEELLKEYWLQIGETDNFYAYLRNIISKMDHSLTDEEKDFNANTQIASFINNKFDDLFYKEEITLPDLSIADAYKNKISPFKHDLATKFKNYEFVNGMEKEIESYKTFLSKARVIVTTNYDMLTENLLKDLDIKPKIYVGQNGFFDKTLDWCELYKIHGDVNSPNSIIINEDDYKHYDNNSILISAKILSTLIESPIIFMGYSLTDRNVRKLLMDFSSQLPKEDLRKSANRILIVEYRKDEFELIEQMSRDEVLDIGYIHIYTDNFKKVYDKISQINEGLTPYEVLRYERAIKELVLAAGSKGALDSVLISPSQIDDLEDQIAQGKPIVVALGNKKYMFVNPDLINYLQDYLFDENNLLPSVALRFVAKENPKSRIPFLKYINSTNLEQLDLHEKEKKKIKERLSKYASFEKLQETIKSAHETGDIDLIINNTKYSTSKKVDLIAYNIFTLDYQRVKSYVKDTAFPIFKEEFIKDKSTLTSSLRRLFLAYDILENSKNQKTHQRSI